MMKITKSKGSTSAVLIAFVVSSLLTSVLGFRQVERITTTPTWVASSNLQAGQTITQELLVKVRAKSPEGIVKDPNRLVGKTLRASKAEGEPFFLSDLSKAQKTWLADRVPEGRVLYTLTPRDGSIPHTQLRNGDRIDVLVKGRRGVRTVARDVLLMGAMKGKQVVEPSAKGRSLITSLAGIPDKSKDHSGTPLVIAVRPQDIYPLASISESEAVTLVLHGQADVEQGRRLEIDPVAASRRQVEVYNGLSRKRVMVRI